MNYSILLSFHSCCLLFVLPVIFIFTIFHFHFLSKFLFCSFLKPFSYTYCLISFPSLLLRLIPFFIFIYICLNSHHFFFFFPLKFIILIPFCFVVFFSSKLFLFSLYVSCFHWSFIPDLFYFLLLTLKFVYL